MAWAEAPNLLLAALHYDALNDAESPLVKFFPSCGGTAEADPAPGLARFFAEPGPDFHKILRERHRRSFAPGRAMLWTAPATLFFQRRGLPYYLVQLDAGAGLDMAADVILDVKGFDSELTAARIGLDPRPIDLSDIADRRWATACQWPDNGQGIAAIDAAIEKVEAHSRRDPSYLQLVPCPVEKAPAFITKNIPSDDPDVGLLIFNSGATSRMDDAEYKKFAEAMESVLKPWGDRGLWVEAEGVRGEAFSQTLQQRVIRWMGTGLQSLVMASFDLALKRHSYNDKSDAFLSVAPPKQA